MKALRANQSALRGLGGQAWAPRWWGGLLVGLALWIATLGATFLTGDIILLPTVVLLGSFLVPVTAVVWYLDHDPSPVLSPRRMMTAFVTAGVIGLLAAAVLESWLVFAPRPLSLPNVGPLPEFLKLALL